MTFVFELMKKEDIVECANVILSSMKNQLTSKHKNIEAVKQMLTRDQTTTLVAKKKGEIVGLVGGTIPNVNYITVLDVQSAREGLADLLLKKYEEVVKQQLPNATFLKASLFTNQPDAVALYSRLGFIVDGFAKDFALGKDMVFMKRLF